MFNYRIDKKIAFEAAKNIILFGIKIYIIKDLGSGIWI